MPETPPDRTIARPNDMPVTTRENLIDLLARVRPGAWMGVRLSVRGVRAEERCARGRIDRRAGGHGP